MNLTVKRKPTSKFIGVFIFGVFLFFISWVQPEEQGKWAVFAPSAFQWEYATPES